MSDSIVPQQPDYEEIIKFKFEIAKKKGIVRSDRFEGYWDGRKLNKAISKNIPEAKLKEIIKNIVTEGGEKKLQKLIRWLDNDQIKNISKVVSRNILEGAFIHARQKETQIAILSSIDERNKEEKQALFNAEADKMTHYADCYIKSLNSLLGTSSGKKIHKSLAQFKSAYRDAIQSEFERSLEKMKYFDMAIETKLFCETIKNHFFNTIIPHCFKVQLDELKIKSLEKWGYQVANLPQPPGFCNWAQDLQSIQMQPEEKEGIVKIFSKLDQMMGNVQNQYSDSMRQEIKDVVHSELPQRLQQLAGALKGRIERENQRCSDFMDAQAKVQNYLRFVAKDERMGRRELYPGMSDSAFIGSDLYLGEGVCVGACYAYAARKIDAERKEKVAIKTAATIQPTAKARILQAGHLLKIRFKEKFEKKVFDFFSNSNLDNRQKCKILLDLSLELSVLSGDKESYKILSTAKKQEKQLDSADDSLLEQIYDKLYQDWSTSVEKYRKQSNPDLDNAFLKRLEIQTKETCFTPPQLAEDFVKNLEVELSKLHLHAEGHAILFLNRAGAEKPQGSLVKPITNHEIYVRFKDGEYELQDVNYPGFTGFRAKDLNEFKVYLALWFSSEGFTHIAKVVAVHPQKLA